MITAWIIYHHRLSCPHDLANHSWLFLLRGIKRRRRSAGWDQSGFEKRRRQNHWLREAHALQQRGQPQDRLSSPYGVLRVSRGAATWSASLPPQRSENREHPRQSVLGLSPSKRRRQGRARAREGWEIFGRAEKPTQYPGGVSVRKDKQRQRVRTNLSPISRRSSVVERILGKVALDPSQSALNPLKSLRFPARKAHGVLSDFAGTFRESGAKVGRFLGT